MLVVVVVRPTRDLQSKERKREPILTPSYIYTKKELIDICAKAHLYTSFSCLLVLLVAASNKSA